MTSNVLVIAKKDLTDAIRSRMLWGAIVLFTLLDVSALFSFSNTASAEVLVKTATTNISSRLSGAVALFGLLAGHKAVVGERESGSIRVLLGLPATRREVLLGKILGRSATLVISVLVAELFLAAVVIALYGGLAVEHFLVLTLLLLVYGIMWVNLGIGISAMVRSRFKAVAIAFGLYAFFRFFWDSNVLPLFAYVFTGSTSTEELQLIPLATEPTWYLYVQRLNPRKTFESERSLLMNLVDPGYVPYLTSNSNVLPDVFGFLLLIGWTTGPLLLGYYRFSRTEFH